MQDSLRKEKSNDNKLIRLREVRVFNIYDRISPQDWYLHVLATLFDPVEQSSDPVEQR